jgi:N-acetylglucosamine-6-sulfatase
LQYFGCLALVADGQDLFLGSQTKAEKAKRPNFVWFLTDDQDQLWGSSFPRALTGTPMPKTKALMEEGGATADNWYIHTPICSPSRSELLTGRYFHNIKQKGGPLWGMHVNETFVNDNTIAKKLKEEGYTVGLFGKYTNVMPKLGDTPAGFDAWLANSGGSYVAPSFQTMNIDGLPDGNNKFPAENYTTAVVGNVSIAWIRKVAQEDKPFFAYIAPKAAHEPFNPAPWYVDAWDPSWPEHEPRDENWNCSLESRQDHPGIIKTQPMISDEVADIITGIWKNRWRTLMSVDDVIGDVIGVVDELGLSDSTYFMYSSDHGFQLGQFNIPMDKRHVYEWDTKIHLVARGPGIKPGSTFANPGTQVDIAPTVFGLAGIEIPDYFDGKSIAPFLVDPTDDALLDSTRQHLESLGDLDQYAQSWRQEVFIEYYFVNNNVKCMNSTVVPGDYPNSDSNCVDLTPGNNAGCWASDAASNPVDLDPTCYATEDSTNNFIAIRNLKGGENFVYAEYQAGDLLDVNVEFDNVDFIEYYDLEKDIHHMNNLGKTASQDELQPLSERVHAWFNCAGKTCP